MFAEDLGVVVVPVVPTVALVALVIGAAIIAYLVALVPALLATRSGPASVLRSE